MTIDRRSEQAARPTSITASAAPRRVHVDLVDHINAKRDRAAERVRLRAEWGLTAEH